jgi:predicted nucleic-acid-binding Zn-ribbon protein
MEFIIVNINATIKQVGKLFDVEEDTYLIKYITNNYSADYPKFISWLG